MNLERWPPFGRKSDGELRIAEARGSVGEQGERVDV